MLPRRHMDKTHMIEVTFINRSGSKQNDHILVWLHPVLLSFKPGGEVHKWALKQLLYAFSLTGTHKKITNHSLPEISGWKIMHIPCENKTVPICMLTG